MLAYTSSKCTRHILIQLNTGSHFAAQQPILVYIALSLIVVLIAVDMNQLTKTDLTSHSLDEYQWYKNFDVYNVQKIQQFRFCFYINSHGMRYYNERGHWT